MTESAFSRIEDLDRNFKNMPNAEGLTWLDAFDDRLSLRGHGWPEEAIQARSFRRFPDRAAPLFSEAIQQLSYCPASVFIAFQTDSPDISVRVANSNSQAMNHMPLTGSAGVELFMLEEGHWIPLFVAVPPSDNPRYERRLMWDMPQRMREFRLYLPLYKELQELNIGFSPGSVIQPSPATAKPIVYYGTSITQGGCANTSGSDFVSTIGRLLGVDTINLGFSGNGKGEPEMAHLIREIDPELFVINYASNCDLPRLQATLPGFLQILREQHPDIPLVLQAPVCNMVSWDRKYYDLMSSLREELMTWFLKFKQAGDRNIHFIDGNALLAPGSSGTYVDGRHPTNLGFQIMAERIVEQLRVIRYWEKERLLAI